MDNIRALVSNYLNLIEDDFCYLTKQNKAVYDDLNMFVNGKSKRIRSLICLLYLNAFGANITHLIIDLLYSTELVHNASLLHDDVIDNSHIRRGVPTLFDKYDSKLSVISGDYLLSIAVEKLLGVNIEVNNSQIVDLFITATKKMSEAEILQYFLREGNPSIEDYLGIIKGKTASLFVACLKSAAILSNLDTDLAEIFAENFGIIFQINNDLDSASAEDDKKNGVKTAVDIIGIEKTLALKDNYKEELSKILVSIPENKYKMGIEDLIKLL